MDQFRHMDDLIPEEEDSFKGAEYTSSDGSDEDTVSIKFNRNQRRLRGPPPLVRVVFKPAGIPQENAAPPNSGNIKEVLLHLQSLIHEEVEQNKWPQFDALLMSISTYIDTGRLPDSSFSSSSSGRCRELPSLEDLYKKEGFMDQDTKPQAPEAEPIKRIVIVDSGTPLPKPSARREPSTVDDEENRTEVPYTSSWDRGRLVDRIRDLIFDSIGLDSMVKPDGTRGKRMLTKRVTRASKVAVTQEEYTVTSDYPVAPSNIELSSSPKK